MKMTFDIATSPELLTTWEMLVGPLLWLVLPNALLNVMCALWLAGELRNRRRLGEKTAITSWVVYSFLVGLALPAVTGPFALHAWRDARRRRHAARCWLLLCTVFSLAGYIGYRVYDAAESRGMRARCWAAAAIFWHLMLVPGVPLLLLLTPSLRAVVMAPANLLWTIPAALLLPVVFPAVYAASRRSLEFAQVRERMIARAPVPGARDGLVAAPPSDDALVSVSGLEVYFPLRSGVFGAVSSYVRAVDGVDFQIRRGEVLGLVGESGCGKTTTGRALLGLEKATAGHIVVDGVDLAAVNQDELRALRARMQVVFQDPIGSLNPRMTVGAIVEEGLRIHGVPRLRRRARVRDMLERVGLDADAARRYPHEFSGGQRQRIGIARALALGADILVCDEPVSALDVSIQAQIVNLLSDLRRELNMSMLFIAHDLAVVEHISDRVAVMYLGKIVEIAPRDDLYARPLHPYTQALLSAIPTPDPGAGAQAPPLTGDMPSPVNPPSGCRFRTRCPRAIPGCAEHVPPLIDYGDDHQAACIRIELIPRKAGRYPAAASGGA